MEPDWNGFGAFLLNGFGASTFLTFWSSDFLVALMKGLFDWLEAKAVEALMNGFAAGAGIGLKVGTVISLAF